MKKILILLIAITSCMVYAEMITKMPSGICTVTTDYYQISFFPKHMLPYEITISGQKFKPKYLDRLYDKNTKKEFFLSKDRNADIKIYKNDDQTVIIETSGKYCLNNTITAPGNVAATYTYTIKKDSPIVDIKCTITQNNDKEWYQLWIMQPAFKKSPFKTVSTCDLGKEVNLSSVSKRTKYSAKNWGVFATEKAAIGISGPGAMLWYDMDKKYYTYLAGSLVKNWKQPKITRNYKMLLGPKQSYSSYNKLFNCSNKSPQTPNNFNFTLKSDDYQVILGPKNTTIRKIIYQGVVLGEDAGWYGTIFAPEKVQFIGAGHSEGGVEEVKSVEITCDGIKQNLKKDMVYNGNNVKFKKISMLGNLKVYMTMTVTSNGIKISKHFEALADQKAYSMYIFQFCWTNKMTNYIAELDNGKIEKGTTTRSNNKFLLNKPQIKYLAMYSKPLGKGIIESFNKIYNTRKQTIWDRKVYKKHYMMLKTPKVYPKGYKSPVYSIDLKGFSSSQSELEKTVSSAVYNDCN